MGIFDALTTAVSGLQAQSYALQNISGNIANSQTTAFKRADTSFVDLVTDNIPTRQISGGVEANTRATNSIQGSLQTSAVSTFMAVQGNGYFVVQQPTSFNGNLPVFGGGNLFTRRGDFQPDKNGYLVNGSGYFLMGIPVDPVTGAPTGSVPQVLQFNNNFLSAQPTTLIQYSANLASSPLTPFTKTGVLGTELLNPAYFEANPLAVPLQPAKITGVGATLLPDAAAVSTGTTDISVLPVGGVTGNLDINGTTINILAGDNAAAVQAKINAQSGLTNVSASLNGANHLVLTGSNPTVNIAINGTSNLALLNVLGLTAGTTTATNLISQNAVAQGQVLNIQIGTNPPNAPLVVTFGNLPGQVETLAQLSTALGTLNPLLGAASVNVANGNINISAASMTDNISFPGSTAVPANFGIRVPLAIPSSQQVVAADVPVFLSQSLSGGSITAYDPSGAPVNVQLRWAKSNGVPEGGTDTWNLFYQINSNAAGTTPAWQNVGTNFTFGANGQMNPLINNLNLTNLTVNGISLGNVLLSFTGGGVTQLADPNGNVLVNFLQQNGSPSGTLQSISVSNQGRVDGSYSNGRTIDLAAITLASFTGQNSLKKLDGGAFQQTAESGTALYNATGKVVGGSLESSNTDIADEFSKLIVTQQAYSANTKIITTGNQMIQDLLAVLR
jgi:flagellar hook protein FlgE